jgi:transcriptional regulator with XRE-family HTH domain
MTVGEHINRARIYRGLSIDELAKKALVSRDTITGWIYRGHYPTLDLLISVADVLDFGLDELVGRERPNEQ